MERVEIKLKHPVYYHKKGTVLSKNNGMVEIALDEIYDEKFQNSIFLPASCLRFLGGGEEQPKQLLSQKEKALEESFSAYLYGKNNVEEVIFNLYELNQFVFHEMEEEFLEINIEPSVKVENNVTVIHFSNLPAKRLLKHKQNGKLNRLFVKNLGKVKLNCNEKFPLYKEKVIIWYRFCFEDAKHLIDYDNFDMKEITDGIAANFLIDDNPSLVSQFFDSQLTGKNELIVSIVPASEFLPYYYSKDKTSGRE